MEPGGFTFPVGMDQEGSKNHGVTKLYGAKTLPTVFVLNHDGKVVYRAETYDDDAIRAALAKLGVKKAAE